MKIRDIFFAVLVALIWGFNFIVIRVGLGSFSPLLFSALRFICAAFPAILFVRRNNIAWRWIISIGFSTGFLMFTLLFLGIYAGMPAGLASLVLQTQAAFTLVLSALILRDPPTFWQKLGMTVAFGGIGLLASHMVAHAGFLGLVLILCSAFAWSISNILIKQAGNIDMFRLFVWMSIVPPLPLFGVSAIFEEGQMQAIRNVTWLGAGTIFYTGIVSTVVAWALWGRLFRIYSPNTVAPFSLLVPIFGILSSVIFLNERLSLLEATASFLVFSGLFLVVFGRRLYSVLRLKIGYKNHEKNHYP
jgi:O-acetylserine/cysteine efflux transporter